MNVYYYKPAEVGMSSFSPIAKTFSLRLAGTDETSDPHQADVFVVPPMIQHIGLDRILHLPHLRGNEKRHVLINIADAERIYLGIPAISFRCDCSKDVLAHDPTSISWPWPSEDFRAQTPLPESGFQYDVTFHGWARLSITHDAVDSVERVSLKCSTRKDYRFWAAVNRQHPEEGTALRANYLEAMQTSRLSLVPYSADGHVRYRFYEAMSMARVPVLICDDCVLPFRDRIDWTRCALQIPERDVKRTGELLVDWLANHSDEELIAMGQYGQEMWRKWLDKTQWERLFTLCVEERL